MKKVSRTACALVLALLPALHAQQRNAPPTSAPDPADEVVRITTNLVQVDAVVTDKDGRVVTDLRAEDFEVLEDGRPQQITNLSFIPLEPALATNAATGASHARAAKDKLAPPVPPTPVRLRPEQVRRTMALVAGNLSFGSTDAVHDALKKYVDEQVQPNDLVAIIQLSRSGGALQQFTTDRRQLALAVEKVRWLPSSGDNVDDVEAARRDDTFKIQPGGMPTFESAETRAMRERMDNSVVGPLCQHVAANVVALTHLVRRMRSLPGRKSVIYFSYGIPIGQGSGAGDKALCVYQALRQLVDAAARASVVIYTIDARGVFNPYHISAVDDVSPDNTAALQDKRARDSWEWQNGLNFIAENTGGRFVHSKNDLNLALSAALEDQRGYYLIGYRPAEATFKGRRFHEIKVRVRRPGLSVRSRSGFFSLPEGESAPAPPGGDRQLYAALVSPIGGSDVRIQLTSFFGNDPRAGSFLRSLLHINAQDITFTDEPGGFKKAVLDVAALTFGESGGVADEFNRTHTVRVGPETFRHIMLHGLSYSADVPVKQAGAYQLRVVVRDAATGRFGTSGQFVEVPDVRKKQFALSGLVVGEANAQGGAPALPPGATAEAALSPVPSAADLSLRRFRPAAVLAYSYVIYNPRLARPANRPQLTTRARLFHAGREVLAGPETPFEPGAQTDPSRLSAGGTLRLPPDAAPGEYVLQIVVTDLLAKPKDSRRITTQWIDFEIVK